MHIHGEDRQVILQGVYELYETHPTTPWEVGQERISRLVVIGTNLDYDILLQSFKKCLV